MRRPAHRRFPWSSSRFGASRGPRALSRLVALLAGAALLTTVLPLAGLSPVSDARAEVWCTVPRPMRSPACADVIVEWSPGFDDVRVCHVVEVSKSVPFPIGPVEEGVEHSGGACTYV